MSYRLDPAMPMSEAVRRVAFGELEIAHGALATPPERHSGVHSARKCLKRLRSLLLLVRPGMPEPVFANLTERTRRHRAGACARARCPCPDRCRRQARARDRTWAEAKAHPVLARLAAQAPARGRAESRAKRGLGCHARAARGAARFRRTCRLSRRFPFYRQRAAPLLSRDPPSRSSMPLPTAATRTSTNGARACSIIGGRCSCLRRAGRRS